MTISISRSRWQTPVKNLQHSLEPQVRTCHDFSLHLQNQEKEPKIRICMYENLQTISISRSRWQTSVRNLQHPLNPQIRTSRTWMFFAPSKSRYWDKILNMFVSKTSGHIQTNILLPSPNLEPPAPSKDTTRNQRTVMFELLGLYFSTSTKIICDKTKLIWAEPN